MGHSLYSTPLFVRLALIMHAKGLQRRECRTGEQDAKQTLFLFSPSLAPSLMRTCTRIHKHGEIWPQSAMAPYRHNLVRGRSLNYGSWVAHQSPSLYHQWRVCAVGWKRDGWATTSLSYKPRPADIIFIWLLVGRSLCLIVMLKVNLSCYFMLNALILSLQNVNNILLIYN